MKNNDNFLDKIIQDILLEEIEKSVLSKMDKLEDFDDTPEEDLSQEDIQSNDEWIEWSKSQDRDEDMSKEFDEGSPFHYAIKKAKEKGEDTIELDGKKIDVQEYDDLEEDTNEGSPFHYAIKKAKEKGQDSIELDGKKIEVKESDKQKKWIQKTKMNKGKLHTELGIPEDEKIPVSKLKSIKSELEKKAKGDKKLTDKELSKLKRVNLALTLGKMNESITLTENELVDIIYDIVIEEKDNIKKGIPVGLEITKKSQKKSSQDNEDYITSVTKKMKEYLSDLSEVEYESNPSHFPKSNYDGKKDKINKYNPSDDVEEYIEAFSFPGQTNIIFDELHPEDKNIKKYLEGDKTTGNATKDDKGKALGNVVPSEVGEKFYKNYKDNIYGHEQKKASYKRYPQNVIDVAGQEKPSKSSKILKQLESKDKTNNLIEENMNRMKSLIGYNNKTQ